MTHLKMAALLAVACLATSAAAQQPARPTVNRIPAASAAGEYRLDERHVAVIVRAPHAGSVCTTVTRFHHAAGTLS